MGRLARFWHSRPAAMPLPKHRAVLGWSELTTIGRSHAITCACGKKFLGSHLISAAVAKEQALTHFYAHCLESERER